MLTPSIPSSPLRIPARIRLAAPALATTLALLFGACVLSLSQTAQAQQGKNSEPPIVQAQDAASSSVIHIEVDTLYQQAQQQNRWVTTHIPSPQNAKLLEARTFELYPGIRAVLYATPEKVILATYDNNGKYIDHLPVAAKNLGEQAYAYLDTKKHRLSVYIYLSFESSYIPRTYQIKPDGQIKDLTRHFYSIDQEQEENIDFFECSSRGLAGVHPLGQTWLLISEEQLLPAIRVRTLRYGLDTIGSEITLIDDPLDPTLSLGDRGYYTLAFKGTYAPEDYTPIYPWPAPADIQQRIAPLVQAQKPYLDTDEILVSPIQPGLWLASVQRTADDESIPDIPNTDFSIPLYLVNADNQLIEVPSEYATTASFFLLKGQLYMLTSASGEGLYYVLYTVSKQGALTRVAQTGFACC